MGLWTTDSAIEIRFVYGWIVKQPSPVACRKQAGCAWLPFLDTYRTQCVAPEVEFTDLLTEIRSLSIAV
jgi:hypothetical protein